MSNIEVFICRSLHMNTSMIPICIWLICRLCTALHTKCCGAVRAHEHMDQAHMDIWIRHTWTYGSGTHGHTDQAHIDIWIRHTWTYGSGTHGHMDQAHMNIWIRHTWTYGSGTHGHMDQAHIDIWIRHT